MKSVSLSLIALGMAAAASSNAAAQSLSLAGQSQYNQSAYPTYDNRNNTQNAQYGYARVVNCGARAGWRLCG